MEPTTCCVVGDCPPKTVRVLLLARFGADATVLEKAAVDAALVQAACTALGCVPAGEAGRGFGAGARRGVMAADQFTQIAGGLFGDAHLSFKATGLFGVLSTSDGCYGRGAPRTWRRGGREESGLEEWEKHGFLIRESKSNPDGSLGAAVYVAFGAPRPAG